MSINKTYSKMYTIKHLPYAVPIQNGLKHGVALSLSVSALM
jgi:hypothetical protein